MTEANGNGNGQAPEGAEENGNHAEPPPPEKKKVNFYEVLGVEKDATDAQLKKAYKKLSLKLHPDKNRDDANAEEKFALLNEAYNTLLDPVKRIDHNKELAGGVVGWGWNQEAAKKRAENYQWNGDDMLFNIGAQLHSARSKSAAASRMQLCDNFASAAKFWGLTVVLATIVEALMVVTAIEAGSPTMAAVWGSILGVFFIIGLMVSVKTNDWTFPVGTLISIVCAVSLMGGLIGGDLLKQSHGFVNSEGKDIDVEQMAISHWGIYSWAAGTRVDTSTVAKFNDVCAVPIVKQTQVGTNYNLQAVGYWAVDKGGCCSNSPPDCDGWDEEWKNGINWYMPDRPTAIFVDTDYDIKQSEMYAAIATVNGGSSANGPVALVWSNNAKGKMQGLYDTPAWVWLVLNTLLWPLVLATMFVVGTFGSCFCVRRIRCNQPLEEWGMYMSGGCPNCWSELEIIDE